MTSIADHFLPDILDVEAKGLLADISLAPKLLPHFMFLDKPQIDAAIEYVKGIFMECYRAGHMRVAVSHHEDVLYGYAMFFELPDGQSPRYIHKIFVHEPYRAQGIGRQLLEALIADPRGVALLTPEKNIAFYEKFGLEDYGVHELPANANFELSLGLYSDLYLMSDREHETGAPIFLLNDNDIRRILSLQ